MSASTESHAAAALLLSMASSSFACTQPLKTVSTPVANTITKPVQKEGNNIQEHLMYVGVSLERCAGESWGIHLFRMGEHFVVGGVEQDVFQSRVTWAWATETPPQQNGAEFRSSFGPLYHTSLLQLVPGDVILSMNGNTLVHSMWDTFASRLDIVAVRQESARRAAQEVLRSSMPPNDANVHFRAAQAAFYALEPVLVKTLRTPKQCQRQLFPLTQPVVARIVSNESVPTRSPAERKRRYPDEALQLSPKTQVTAPQFQKWLHVRKDQWRSDRSKKRRLYEPKRQLVIPPPQQLYHVPCQFLCFRLDRESLETPWGIHVSHHDGKFLGVGSVHECVAARTSWAWATTNSISAALLNVKDENSIRTVFASLPFHPSSLLQLEIGDFILSVSGHAVASFASLQEIARFMTRVKSLTLIVLRHQIPSDIAQFATRQGKAATEITNLAYQSLIPVLYRSPNAAVARLFHSQQQAQFRPKLAAPVVIQYRNPLFQDDKGDHILYQDQGDLEINGGTCEFLSLIDSESFPSWMRNRQATWRKLWSNSLPIVSVEDEWCDGDESSIATDFWTQQGYATFDDWIAASTFKWKQSYSWNRKKRERLVKECEEVVHYPLYGSVRNENMAEQTQYWLRVRKQQWRLIRRKRQRRLELEMQLSTVHDEEANGDAKLSHTAQRAGLSSAGGTFAFVGSPRPAAVPRQTSVEMVVIDAFLAEQERQEQKLSPVKRPLDISFLFDAALGAPDDVVAHCLEFLPPSDHAKLLFISSSTSVALKERDEVWRQLCPSRWILPRRPRKRWHEVYLTKIHDEVRAKRKWADDFLNKATDILFHQDNLTKIERLVEQGEKRVDFDINYISSVVAERNSLLNLAAIYSRAKVVRWLVETKNADIETFDRGGFTPLINAAWAGDQKLVRYLLSRGADRTKIGMYHYFTGINKPDFNGLSAEGWARKKGHHHLAELIRLGL